MKRVFRMPTPSRLLLARISILALTAIPLFAPPAPAQKVPDIRLDTGTPPGRVLAYSIDMAASGNEIYVVWQDDRDGQEDVFFNRSLDAGATWLPSDVRLDTLTLPGSTRSTAPKIAASGSTVYVVWSEDLTSTGQWDVYFNRSTDSGSTWLPIPNRVDHAPEGAASGAADLAVVGSSIYVAWMDWRNGGFSDIYFTRSLDGGATWPFPDTFLNNGNPPGHGRGDNPKIAASGSSVYVVWEDWRNGGSSQAADIFANASTDGGATWLSPDVRLNTGVPPGADAVWDVRLAACGSRAYATWTDARNGGYLFRADIFFNATSDGGATWFDPDVRLNVGTASAAAYTNAAEIACAGNAVYVAWEDSRNATFWVRDIFFNRSLDGGVSWLPVDVRLDVGSPPGAKGSQFPDIAAYGTNVYVSWQDNRNGNHDDQYFNRSSDSGGTWLPSDIRINTGVPPGSADAQNVRIAATSTGVHLVWEDRRSDPITTDIYYNLALGMQPYGAGTAGAGGLTPVLSGSGTPVIGGSISIDIAQGLGGAPGFFLLGWSGQASIPLLGGVLLVQPPFLSLPVTLSGAPGTPGAGAASLPLALPNNANLIGLPLDFQALLVDPGAPAGVSMTNGVEVWIG